MLVKDFNMNQDELGLVAGFIKNLNSQRTYMVIPIRPPAEAYVKPPTPEKLVGIYALFADELGEE